MINVIIGDLLFYKRYKILNKYKQTFSEEIYTKLWSNIWEEELLIELNHELRKIKITALINENEHII